MTSTTFSRTDKKILRLQPTMTDGLRYIIPCTQGIEGTRLALLEDQNLLVRRIEVNDTERTAGVVEHVVQFFTPYLFPTSY